MILSSILHREFLEDAKTINILWTPTDHMVFKEFIKKCLPNVNFLEFDHTYFGNCTVDIVICNNRISHLEKSLESAKYFHCPVLVVDQEIKPISLNLDNVGTMPIEPVQQIAINKFIADSWGGITDRILHYDPTDKENIEEWQKIIYVLIKSVTRIKE